MEIQSKIFDVLLERLSLFDHGDFYIVYVDPLVRVASVQKSNQEHPIHQANEIFRKTNAYLSATAPLYLEICIVKFYFRNNNKIPPPNYI